MYNEKEFVELIKAKAKEKDLVIETNKELELFSKFNQIDYLYIVNKFIQRIKKECVPGMMLRMAGSSSVIA